MSAKKIKGKKTSRLKIQQRLKEAVRMQSLLSDYASQSNLGAAPTFTGTSDISFGDVLIERGTP
jgi:hypothetical protein